MTDLKRTGPGTVNPGHFAPTRTGRDQVPAPMTLPAGANPFTDTGATELSRLLARTTYLAPDHTTIDVTGAQADVLDDHAGILHTVVDRGDGSIALVTLDSVPPNPRRIYPPLGLLCPARAGLLPCEVPCPDGDPVDGLRAAFGVDTPVLAVYGTATGDGWQFRLGHPDSPADVLAGWVVIPTIEVEAVYGRLDGHTWDLAMARVDRELGQYAGYLAGRCFDVQVIDPLGGLRHESFSHYRLEDALTDAHTA